MIDDDSGVADNGENRIWDVENKRKQKTVIVVKSKERGARTKVTACNYSPDGNLIGGGAPLSCQKYLVSLTWAY